MTGVVLDHVSSLLYSGKTRDKSIFPKKHPLDVWGGGVLPCDVSLASKKYIFFAVDNLLLIWAWYVFVKCDGTTQS